MPLSNDQRQAALRRILTAANDVVARSARPAARTAGFALTLAALWQIAGGDPSSLGPFAPLVTMLSAEVLGSLIDRVAHDDDTALDPERLQSQVETALATHGVGGVLTEGEFYHALRLLTNRREERDVLLLEQLVQIEELLARQQSIQPTIPLQRPPRHDRFTGRDAELAAILKGLEPGRTLTLAGPGGIGKTAIAAEVAWQLAPEDDPPKRFPAGIVFHSFYNQPEIARAAEHIIRSFWPSADDLSLDVLGRILANRRALLILDGTEDTDDLPALLARTGACAVLITTRDRRHAPGDAIAVPVLDLDRATQLLRDWGGEFLAPAAEPQLRTMAGLLGRLPLALRLAGRYLSVQKEPLDSYMRWLGEEPIDALNPYHAEHRQDNVDRLLERSLAQVSEEACLVLSAAGVHALDPLDPDLVTDVLGLDQRKCRRVLGDLLSYGLLTRDETGRVAVMHVLIHAYACAKLDLTDELLHRLVEAYGQRFRTESEAGIEGLHRLDLDRSHAIRLLSVCSQRQAYFDTIVLADALESYLSLQGRTQDNLDAQQMALTAARGLGSRPLEGVLLGRLANAHCVAGEAPVAIDLYKGAVAIAREGNDPGHECIWLNGLAVAYHRLGYMKEAVGCYKAALLVAREIGERHAEGHTLNDLGIAHRDLGDVRLALRDHEAALAIFREVGYRRGEASSLDNLGQDLHILGRIDEAVQCYKDSSEINRQLGDRRGEEGAMGNLANALRGVGRIEEALTIYGTVLSIAKEIDDPFGEVTALLNIGQALTMLGRFEEALPYYRNGLAASKEIGARGSEAAMLGHLGVVLHRLERREDAIEYYQKSMAVACEIGDLRLVGINWQHLGILFFERGCLDRAIECYQRALGVFRHIGDRRNEAASLGNLGTARRELGDPRASIEAHQNALHIAREIRDRHIEGVQLSGLAGAYARLGRAEEAVSLYRKSLTILEDIKSPDAEAVRIAFQDLRETFDR